MGLHVDLYIDQHRFLEMGHNKKHQRMGHVYTPLLQIYKRPRYHPHVQIVIIDVAQLEIESEAQAAR